VKRIPQTGRAFQEKGKWQSVSGEIEGVNDGQVVQRNKLHSKHHPQLCLMQGQRLSEQQELPMQLSGTNVIAEIKKMVRLKNLLTFRVLTASIASCPHLKPLASSHDKHRQVHQAKADIEQKYSVMNKTVQLVD
jgi:hypothetical protein